jgi:hypothetical protein
MKIMNEVAVLQIWKKKKILVLLKPLLFLLSVEN